MIADAVQLLMVNIVGYEEWALCTPWPTSTHKREKCDPFDSPYLDKWWRRLSWL
jgi:hypothetical protein